MSDQQPLVSVCMPLYNTERFVAEAITGVLKQTHRNLELIICDNCSTDGSLAIVEELARRDSRVRLVRNRRNLGYAGNLHKVLLLARGDLMMVHCADDLAVPTALERLVGLFSLAPSAPGHIIAISDYYFSDSGGRPLAVHTQRSGGYETEHLDLGSYHGTGEVRRFKGRVALAAALRTLSIVGFQGATLYPRALFESIEGLYSGLLYSPDAQLNYLLLSRDPEVRWLHEPLFHWRQHEGGQIGLARSEAVPKHSWDGYYYTFMFPDVLLKELGVSRVEIVQAYIKNFCLQTALREIKDGSQMLAFRHVCLALATYPGVAARSPKFYAALLGSVAGPLGRGLARLGYRCGAWRQDRTKKATASN
jgi:glycosyltransferase involved in cell wall biosynthesis